MRPPSEFPGRCRIRGKWHWVASKPARAAGFVPRTMRLPDDESRHSALCAKLWAEMLQWTGDEPKRSQTFDGTVKSLFAVYLRNDVSPFHSVEARTQRNYVNTIRSAERSVGARRIDHLTGEDFRRWHGKWSAGGKLRGAQEHVKVLRVALNFGAELKLSGCATAADILSRIEFPGPKKRSVFLTRDHVAVIIETALATDTYPARSVALGQAIQYETTLRQTDVIGVWRPRPRALEVEEGMVLRHSEYWSDGLTWERCQGGAITGNSLKQGEPYTYPLDKMPLTARVMARIPADERRGPLIAAAPGEPMSDDHYRKLWRKLADKAGVPRKVWNRDSRAGGITEASDLGVALEDARHMAGHATASTTAGYSRNRKDKTARAMDARLQAVSGEFSNAFSNSSLTSKKDS